jgi:hypothetical protein
VIGISFVSGADEALFFEKLNFDKNSTDWRKLVNRGSQVALLGIVVATVAGGWLHSINPRIPWVLSGLSLILSTVLIWNITDDRPKKARQPLLPELKNYLRDIKAGFAQFRLPKLSLYVPYIITVQGLFYTTDFGLLRLVFLDRFHFNPFWGAVAIASSSLITVGLLSLMHKNNDQLSEKKVLIIIGLTSASSLLLSLANIGMWGYIVIFALYAGEYLLQPFMSEIINNRAAEDQRATVLSVATFLKSTPYIALAPIIGYLNTNEHLEYFLISWSLLIVIAVAMYLISKKRDSVVSLSD